MEGGELLWKVAVEKISNLLAESVNFIRDTEPQQERSARLGDPEAGRHAERYVIRESPCDHRCKILRSALQAEAVICPEATLRLYAE